MNGWPILSVKRPVVAAVAAFTAGLWIGSRAPAAPLPLYISVGIVALAALFAWRRTARFATVALMTLFFAGGAAYWESWHQGPPGDGFARDVAARPDGTAYQIEGRVRLADVWLEDRDYTTAIVTVERATRAGQTLALRGRTLVRWSEPAFALHPGDRVRMRGAPSLKIAHVNPGTSGPEEHYRRRGVHTALRLRGAGEIQIVEGGPRWGVRNALSRFRGELANRLERAVPASTLPLLLTMWLGDRRQIDSELYREFVESGTAHILAVSGLHVAIVFASVRVLLRVATQRRRVRLVLSLLSVVAVAGMTGFYLSTVRAATMIAIYLVAEWFEREPDTPSALAIAAALFLATDPDLLYDVAFQLSFLSVASLLLFDAPLSEAMESMAVAPRSAVSATLAVQVLPWPFAVLAFHVAPLLSPLANLVVIPLTGVMLWLGFLTSACAFLMPPLAPVFGHALHPVAQAILGVVNLLGTSQRTYLELTSPTGWAIAAYGTMAYCMWRALRRDTRVRGRWVTGAALACAATWSPWVTSPAITVLDVGHGDAVFVRAPGGNTMLVDAGMGSEFIDEGARTVAPFLWSNHVQSIDVLMLTHPDADHMGGAKYVLRHFRVGTLVLGPEPFSGTMEDEVIAIARSRGVIVRRVGKGDRFELGRAEVNVLHPPRDGAGQLEENDRSLVARVSWDGFSTLLTGDIEQAGEAMLADSPLASNAIKVPHHGSITSSGEGFIDAVAPAIAVISVGPRGRQHVLSP